MGWSNYIVIDDWKVIVEVPREISEDDTFFEEGMEALLEHMEDVDYDMLEVKVKDISIKELTMAFETTRKALFLAGENTNFDIQSFLYFLKARKIPYRIEDPDEIEGKYKDYKKVER